MAVSKDLRGGSVKKALHKAEKANKNPNAKKAVNAKKTTSLKATAVKPARFNRGVAGVAVASTLAMMLPSAAASALQINQQNIVDSANVVSKAGKGNLRSQELNMLVGVWELEEKAGRLRLLWKLRGVRLKRKSSVKMLRTFRIRSLQFLLRILMAISLLCLQRRLKLKIQLPTQRQMLLLQKIQQVLPNRLIRQLVLSPLSLRKLSSQK